MYHMHEETRISDDDMQTSCPLKLELQMLYTTWHGCWVLSPGPLAKQQMLLTAKPSPICEQSIKIIAPQLNDSKESSITICVHCLSSSELYFSVTI